jgi:hypothetical protein
MLRNEIVKDHSGRNNHFFYIEYSGRIHRRYYEPVHQINLFQAITLFLFLIKKKIKERVK